MREILMIIALVVIIFALLLQISENISLVIEAERAEREEQKAKSREPGAGERYG